MLNESRVRYALVFVLALLAGGSIFTAVASPEYKAETRSLITTPVSKAALNAPGASGCRGDTDASPASGSVAVHITGAVKTPNLYKGPYRFAAG